MSVPVVTPSECAKTIGPREDGQLCAGGEAGKDSCGVSGDHERDKIVIIWFTKGDSGGPLTYESGNQHILIGDVSFGFGDCATVWIENLFK